MKVLDYSDLAGYRRTVSEIDRKIYRTVETILAAVKKRGDKAVLDFTRKFDRVTGKGFALFASEAEFAEAQAKLSDPRFRAAYEAFLAAADNIRVYHEKQLESGWSVEVAGSRLGQIVRPVERAGVYVPGGAAFYPSSLLMNVVPATCAGVPDLLVATPPSPEGKLPPMLLCLAEKLGVRNILKAGGAQAIAAMAYGTESVPAVCKITGPGNSYVAVAKQLVSGIVGIDSIAGPSEIVILADSTANPAYLAADLIAQAEHRSDGASFLVSTDAKIIEETNRELDKQIASQPREKYVRGSLAGSFAVLAPGIDEAFDIVNRLAPEHLEAILDMPEEEILSRVKNAGAVFLGAYSPVAAGDYFAGTNHVLPTSGTAVFSSPLGVYDFMKRTSWLSMPESALKANADRIAAMARYEGLEAHARSAEIREKIGKLEQIEKPKSGLEKNL